ncbi:MULTISPECIES: peptide chain release factor N(5)-glutamine methyltransferase [unclassified Sphingomonas]|uniref:peptide chain release factor N(5)-glutamine methyltransferase n=1 Tax=unclassified Sphingomonas TaxID=196159 RepID=UPI00092801ED|nr:MULTISPECIES: peptide chain release factor N(5)-glutamine methyltransferase [unclassified Sphingomonas]OJV34462.1 MAG: protein-(glutamine-N5) methyltransferase, release factor-specific [Sphingomonas sp. 67-36]
MPPSTPPDSGKALESARAALTDATARFAFSATPRLDAELLLAHALGITRERMLLTLADHAAPPAFAALVERRARYEPVAYITGARAFWTIDLDVAPGVLVPRADSETLIEAAVAHFNGTAGPGRVLDLGTGSGALLLAALDQWPQASGVGLDASPAALAIARDNAARIAPGRATIAAGGWDGTGEAFDLILCNPPYIAADAALSPEVAEYEPASALFAGPEGLDDYRAIAPVLGRQIAPGGVACIEIGYDQGESAATLFRAAGLAVALRRDLAGRDRCLVVTP